MKSFKEYINPINKTLHYIDEAKGSFIAWHGSGMNFNAFVRSKAHTGEGGAAFGSGIYISKNKKVAEFYQSLSKKPTATLYKVKVNIDTDRIMRWDTPFNKQPKFVQNVLKTIDYDGSRGEEARYYYHTLRASYGTGAKSGPVESEKASEYLETQGIQAIFFIGDRKFSKTRDISQNFVIFNPSILTILDKFNKRGKKITG